MAMVFCRGCGKEIHETARVCPHCGAPQGLAPSQAKTSPAGGSKAVSVSWQKKFALLKKAGGPRLPLAKELTGSELRKVVFNIWGALLGPFYYLAKGMWKKTIVLFTLAMVIIVILDVVLQSVGISAKMAEKATYFVSPAIFGTRATIDYYKKVVLGDNGWW